MIQERQTGRGSLGRHGVSAKAAMFVGNLEELFRPPGAGEPVRPLVEGEPRLLLPHHLPPGCRWAPVEVEEGVPGGEEQAGHQEAGQEGEGRGHATAHHHPLPGPTIDTVHGRV